MSKNRTVIILVGVAVVSIAAFLAFQKPAIAPIPTPSPRAVLTPAPTGQGILIEGQKGVITGNPGDALEITVNPLSPTPTASPALPSPGPVVVDMVARQWVFEPATIRVKLGQKVTLNITSTDVTHGIAVPQFGVSANLQAGQITAVTFTPDKTGSFTFFCNVFCGSGHSDMRGTLVVE